MADFNTLWNTLGKEVGNLAKSQLPGFWKTAEKDGKNFLNNSKGKLEKWSKQLANGELSKTDFESLVMGLKDLTEMKSLESAGLALAQVERFKSAVINTTINTIFKMLL